MQRAAILFLTTFAFTASTWAYESVKSYQENPSSLKVLVFLSKNCPCSRSHVDHLNGLSQKYPNIAFYGVITDFFDKDSEPEIKAYFDSQNFKFPLIKDSEQMLVKKYGALKTPFSVIVQNQSSQEQVLYEGGVSDDHDFPSSTKHYLEENLAALAQGKDPIYKVGKSLGCYIRRF
tara:strand:- start:2408 stop:2935 length:528 start_codon:yes stop_codon:yes gene_type:complete